MQYEIFGSNPAMSSAEGDSTFSHFARLPPEVRCQIWLYFCPELEMPSRLYRLSLNDFYSSTDQTVFPLCLNPNIADFTRGMRTVLSVHRHSRDFASMFVPHSVPIQPTSISFKKTGGMLRVNGRTDIISLPRNVWSPEYLGRKHPASEYLELVENIAITPGYGPEISEDAVHLSDRLREWTRLKRLYICAEPKDYRALNLRWTAAELCNTQVIQLETLNSKAIYCWPAQTEQELERLPHSAGALAPTYHSQGWRLLPMVSFVGVRQMARYDLIHDYADLSDEEFKKKVEPNYERQLGFSQLMTGVGFLPLSSRSRY